MRARLFDNSRLMCATACLASAISAGETFAAESPGIRLVLQITVDGLRGDQLARFRSGFGEGGFRTLVDRGTVYANAHYQHANTETIVGHTTLATGASPSEHGMIGNAWFDRGSGTLGYNIEDPDFPLVPTRNNQATGEQIDPAQKASRSDGRSPRSILAPTLSDTLHAYYAGRSRIFAVSGKDRGAVPMAGHAGKAFWVSTDSGDFVTSAYYYSDYPEWVRAWNAKRHADNHAGSEWKLTDDVSSYLLGDRDDRPYEADLKGYGRTFPHPFGSQNDTLFYTRLLVSPVGDELTADFARTLLAAEELGTDDIPDYLSVSFSGVDAVNHFFGPSSLEQETVIRRLDRTLSDLFAFVDETVGLRHTLIVLAADHGMADMPESMGESGLQTGRLTTQAITDAANAAGLSQFDVENLVQAFYRPYVYLDLEKIRAKDLDRKEVENFVAAAIAEVEGVAQAIPVSGFPSVEETPVVKRVRRNCRSTPGNDHPQYG